MKITWTYEPFFNGLQSSDEKWRIALSGADFLIYKLGDNPVYTKIGMFGSLREAIDYCEVNDLSTDEFLSMLNTSNFKKCDKVKTCSSESVPGEGCKKTVEPIGSEGTTTVKIGDNEFECKNWTVELPNKDKTWEQIADERGKTIQYLNNKINSLKTQARQWKEDYVILKEDYEWMESEKNRYMRALADQAVKHSMQNR